MSDFHTKATAMLMAVERQTDRASKIGIICVYLDDTYGDGRSDGYNEGHADAVREFEESQ